MENKKTKFRQPKMAQKFAKTNEIKKLSKRFSKNDKCLPVWMASFKFWKLKIETRFFNGKERFNKSMGSDLLQEIVTR